MSTPQETVMEIVALAKQGQSLAEQARDLDPTSPDYKHVMIDLGHVIGLARQDQPKPSRRPAPARQAPTLCN